MKFYRPLHHLTGLLLLGLLFCRPVQAKSWPSELKQPRYLVEVLDEISERYQIFFSYETKFLKELKVDFHFREGESMQATVDRLLGIVGLEYKNINNKYYVIYSNTKNGQRKAKKLKRKIDQIQRLEEKGKMNLEIKQKNKLDHLRSISDLALKMKKKTTVSGKVIDEEGEPLIGVNIIIKGTSQGTVTDVNGQFNLDIDDLQATLILSYIGYETLEVSINGQTMLEITMQADAEALDEVIIVGYGSVKKSDLTGSVASIKTEALDRQPVTTVDQGLQGLAPGIQVQQTSGAPGGAVTLRIRGANSISAGNEPLYVIDGLPIVANNAAAAATPSIVGFGSNFQPGQATSPLASISPNDIESIEILKDASATALYGARASNGVVLITTKRGKTGRSTISFDAYYGVQEISNNVDFMSAQQHLSYLEDAIENGASSLSLTDLPNNNTDWFDLIQAESPIIQNYTLGINGGNEKAQYSVSLNHFDQEGIIKNTGIDRTAIRANVDITPNDRLRVGVSMNTSYTSNQIQFQNGVGNYGLNNSAFTWAQWLSPLQAANNPDGSLAQDYLTGDPISNPAALVASNVVNEVLTFRTFGTVYAEYEIFKNLKYKINLGGDLQSTKRNSFFPTTHPFGISVNSLGGVSNNLLTNWLVENIVTYDLNIGDHKLDLIGGITSQQELVQSSVVQAENFAIDNLSFNSLQQGAVRNGRTGINRWALQSFFAQANYNFKERYLLTVNMRADGSSKFGRNNRYGYFPSAALAWRVIEEPFFDPLKKIFSDMKFRVSYGQVGNQEIPANLAFAAFNASPTTALSNDPDDALGVNGLNLSSLANPNLKWETTTQLNIGWDFGLLNNRITITADYYQKITDDLLLATPLPATSGFTAALQNVGQVENSGFELGMNAVLSDSEFKWVAGLNLSRNVNEVNSLVSGLERTFVQPGALERVGTIFAIEEGQPLGSFYGYQYEGIYQIGDDDIPEGFAPGDPRYADISGPEGIPDGVISEEDQTIIGDPNPGLVFGFTNNFEFKGFDLSLFFNGELNRDMINWNRTFWETGLVDFQRTPNAANAWSEDNPTNDIPRIGFSTRVSSTGNEAMSSRLVEDGTFIRLRNLTIGYTFPIQSKSISHLRIYATGQNLLTITDYSGFDPEANYTAGNAQVQGLDFGSYPLARTYMFGVQAKF